MIGVVRGKRRDGTRIISNDWCHCGDLPSSEFGRSLSWLFLENSPSLITQLKFHKHWWTHLYSNFSLVIPFTDPRHLSLCPASFCGELGYVKKYRILSSSLPPSLPPFFLPSLLLFFPFLFSYFLSIFFLPPFFYAYMPKVIFILSLSWNPEKFVSSSHFLGSNCCSFSPSGKQLSNYAVYLQISLSYVRYESMLSHKIEWNHTGCFESSYLKPFLLLEMRDRPSCNSPL